MTLRGFLLESCLRCIEHISGRRPLTSHLRDRYNAEQLQLTPVTLAQMPDVNINDLEKEWGLSRNGIKNRAKALGVQLLRPSHHETCWPAEYLEAGRDLDRWVKSGKPLAEHPGIRAEASVTPVAPSPQASDLVALLEAVKVISQSPAVADPLAVAQGLRAAVDNELTLTGPEMATLLGKKSMHTKDDGSEPRPGYVIQRVHHRTRKTNKSKTTFWQVRRM